MVFYRASADILRPLRDAPWLDVTGCATPTGQVTSWKLNLLRKDMMGTNAFPLSCSEAVTVLYVLQRLTHSVGLIIGDQPKLSAVKT